MTAHTLSFYLSWHGLLCARVSGPTWLTAPVFREFAHYQSPPLDVPDLDLTLQWTGGPRDRDPAGSEHEWTGARLGARWRVKAGPPDRLPLRVWCEGSLAARFIAAKWIVEPAVRIAAHHQGLVPVHAAALADGNQAVLVAGPGGAGKTTWVLHWLAAGHPYLSDDFSLLDHDRVMPYLTPLRLGAGNLMVNPILNNMKTRDRAEIILRTALRRALLGRAKFYFKAPIQRAVPGIAIAPPSPLAGALWLEQQANAPQALAPEEIAARMAQVNRAEMHGFGEGGPAGNYLPEDFWSVHQSRLASSLAGKPCYSVPAPRLPPAFARASVPALFEWLSPSS